MFAAGDTAVKNAKMQPTPKASESYSHAVELR